MLQKIVNLLNNRNEKKKSKNSENIEKINNQNKEQEIISVNEKSPTSSEEAIVNAKKAEQKVVDKSTNDNLKKFVPKEGDEIKNQSQLIDLICDELKHNKSKVPATVFIYGGKHWQLIKKIVETDEFKDELKISLENRRIDIIVNYPFLFEVPQDNAKEIAEGIFILQKEKNLSVISHKAKITAIGGSMEKKSYTLNAENRKTWNIGRKEKTELDDGTQHTNNIAIKPDKNDPDYQINRHVSRRHAVIVFDPNVGYKLKTYRNWDKETMGYKLAKTSIRRNGEEKNLDDESKSFSLQNKDKIILNDSVVLCFEFEKSTNKKDENSVNNIKNI